MGTQKERDCRAHKNKKEIKKIGFDSEKDAHDQQKRRGINYLNDTGGKSNLATSIDKNTKL